MIKIYKRILFKISFFKSVKFLLPLIAIILMAPGIGLGQTTIFSENMGTPTGTPSIASYATGTAPATFQNKGTLSYVGTADVRITLPSSGYTGASGNGNVFFAANTNRYFTIYNINSSAYTNMALSFGFYKDGAAGSNITSSNFVVEVATDYDPVANTGTFTALPYATVTTGAVWSLVSATGTIPSSTTLAIRFRQNQAVQQIRIDDVKLTGFIPIITPTPTTLTGFFYSQGTGPSVAQSFTLSANNLAAGGGNITISAASDYTVSVTSATSGFSASSVILPYTSTGTLASNTVWVRLKGGLVTGIYNLEAINISGSGATSSVTVSGSVAPANDDCTNAISITPSTSCVNTAGTNVNATQSLSASSCTTGSGESLDVWYKFTANGTSAYTISATPASNKFSLVLYSGTCTSLTELGCDEGGSGGATASIISSVLAAGTYYYRIYGRSGSINTFNTCVTIINPPACATLLTPTNAATGVSVEPITLTWSATTGATSYDIYIGTTNTPTLTANVTGTTTTITGALSGTTYYWYIVPRNVAGAATGCISNIRSFTTTAGPANDECAGATQLVMNASAISGTNVNADQTLAPILCNASTAPQAYDVWYKFTAINASEIITITGVSTFDPVAQGFSGTCGSLTSLTCADATVAGGTETLTLSGLIVCNTYYVRVYNYAAATGTFAIKVAGTSAVSAPTAATVTPGVYCDNISGNITLIASGGTGGTLTWYAGGCGTGTAVGTGSPLTIARPTSTTTYYVRRELSCDISACGPTTSTTVTINTSPTIYILSGGGAYCNGGNGVTLTLSGSQTGVDYQLYRNGVAVGTPVAGTGSAFTTANITTAGTYTIKATNSTTSCTQDMNGSPVISVTPRPTGVISGSQTICPGQTTTVSITVTGTGPWSGTLSNGQAFSGSSSPISVNITPIPTVNTSYTLSTLIDANCTSKGADRSGTAVVTINAKSGDPTSAAASPSAICKGASTTLTLSGGGGLSGEVIHWYSGSCGGTSVGTGNNLVVNNITSTTTFFGRYEDASPCVYNSACASVTVTATTPPSATIAYNGSPFCSKAGSAAVTRTGTAGGTYSSTAGLSINSSTGAINIGASNSGIYDITYTIAASGGCSIYTATTNITINYNTWIGLDTIWNKAANWSCGTIPDSMSNVYLPSGLSVYPVVPIGNFSLRDLLLRAGASLIVGNPIGAGQAVLSVFGTYNNTGTLADSGRLVLAGSVLQTFPGVSSNLNLINELEIKNAAGVSINKSFTITGGLIPTTGNLALNNNYITLKSDSTVVLKITRYNSAYVGELGTGASFTYGNGRFVAERYFHAKRAWRLVTAPVTTASSSTIYNAWQLGGKTTLNGAPAGSGVMITGPETGMGLDPGVNNLYSLKSYDPLTGALIPVSNTKGLKLSPNTYGVGGTGQNIGYFLFVRGDRNPSLVGSYSIYNDSTTLRDTGIIQTGNQVFNFPLADTAGNKFILLPNPYASAINFADLAVGNPSIQTKFWAWDPGAGGPQSVGAYIYLDSLSNYTDVPSSPGGQNRFVQSHQAVYVQTTNTGSATITVKESYKSTRTIRRPLFRPLIFNTEQLSVNLNFLNEDNSTELGDGVMTQFSSVYADSVDKNDGLKFQNPAESFAFKRDGQLLTVERRNILTQNDTLFFNLVRTTQRSYQLEFVPDGLDGTAAFLIDSYLKTSTPVSMSQASTLNFTITTDAGSAAADRFMIVFRPSATLPVTFTRVKAYQQGSNINVEWSIENEVNTRQYEVERSTDGRIFTNSTTLTATRNNGTTATYTWPDASPANGANYYRIKSMSKSGEIRYSSIVKVTIGNGRPLIAVYPNPASGGTINLQLINQPAGRYGIRLLDKIGQVILVKQTEHSEGSSTETLQVSKAMAHGNYQLEITKPDGGKTNISVLY